jgi:hypothetical protein
MVVRAVCDRGSILVVPVATVLGDCVRLFILMVVLPFGLDVVSFYLIHLMGVVDVAVN